MQFGPNDVVFDTGANGVPTFKQGMVLIAEIHVPADIQPGQHFSAYACEYVDAPKKRYWKVSDKPCDLTPFQQGNSLDFSWQCGYVENPGSATKNCTPGQVIYINIVNQDPSQPPKHGASWDESRNMRVGLRPLSKVPA
jgi:hypothetical protein